MKKKTSSRKLSLVERITQSKLSVIVIAIISIILGIVFIASQSFNKPISRSEAVPYSGELEEYEVWGNYRTIHFKDGSSYEVYTHAERQDFQNTMKSLPKGTKLYLLINPNNNYVIEVKTETEELLNFEASQEAIDSYDNGYIAIGIVVCTCGVLLILWAIFSSKAERKETARHAEKTKKRVKQKDDPAIRHADYSVKGKILLAATIEEYKISYRRVKSVNELIVNGVVYDEKKGIIEFAHNLSAVIDGHTIEAGLDKDSYSYIRFDGELIADKKRII
ncbi:MAG: hypothetical protein E7679_07295 [Ruminococcaceae bacterium]|nr:hypothetical protein [Oscillospiraceae bacterium]